MESRTLHELPAPPGPADADAIDADDTVVLATGRAARGAVCPRCGGPSEVPAVLECGPLRLERVHSIARVGGRTVAFTRAEFDVLWRIAARHGRLAPYAWLGRLAARRRQTPGFVATPDGLKVLVHRVRRKLRAPGLIETVRGEGFRLNLPPSTMSPHCGDPT